jgi:hypothetical protein
MTSNPASSSPPNNPRPRINDIGRYRDHQFTIFATSNPSWCREYAGEFLKSLPPITHVDGTEASLLIDAIGSSAFIECINRNKRNPLDSVALRLVEPEAENNADLQRIACNRAIRRNTNMVMFEDISDPTRALPLDYIRELFQTSHHLAFGLTVGDNLGLFEKVFEKLGVSTADLRILMKPSAQPFQLFYNGLNETEALNEWVRAHLQTHEPANA